MYRRRLAGLIAANGSSSPDMHLFWGGLKEFADGSLGAKTALFHKPYLHQAGEPESRGVRTKEKKVLADLVSQADRAGLQVVFLEVWSFVQANLKREADEQLQDMPVSF